MLLLVDDDRMMSGMVKEFLESNGYDVNLQHNGQDGLQAFKKQEFDLCLLDVKMPNMDGFELASKIRELDEFVPIIFLTSKSEKESKLKGFDLGADDYVTKPFSMAELVARVKVILKRYNFQQKRKQKLEVTGELSIGNFSFDSQTRLLSSESFSKKLSAKEAGLLQLLILHKNQVLQRSVALKEVWGEDDYFKGMSMNVYITKLRKYLKADPSLQILNVHGEGYKLVD